MKSINSIVEKWHNKTSQGEDAIKDAREKIAQAQTGEAKAFTSWEKFLKAAEKAHGKKKSA